MLSKVRYQLGGDQGYGYLQLSVRDQAVVKDDSALLTTFTPPGFVGGGDEDDAGGVRPFDLPLLGGYQSFTGTTLGAHQTNYGFDAQLPLGNEQLDGAPATTLQFSHLTSLNSQSVSGPGQGAQPYLYNQRDFLGDDWLQIDHRFSNGLLSFKYDLGTETLTTNYVQGQVTAELRRSRRGRRVSTQRRRDGRAGQTCRHFADAAFGGLALHERSDQSDSLFAGRDTTATSGVSAGASTRAPGSSGPRPAIRPCALPSERRFKPRSSRSSSSCRRRLACRSAESSSSEMRV